MSLLYFIVGFLLGASASWFWFYRHNPGVVFRQFLQKELDSGGHPDLARQIRRIDNLEERCRLLEKGLPVSARGRFGEAGAGGTGTAGWKREQAVALWEEGCGHHEIVRRTGLSRGEIELILSLREQH